MCLVGRGRGLFVATRDSSSMEVCCSLYTVQFFNAVNKLVEKQCIVNCELENKAVDAGFAWLSSCI